MVSRPCPSRDKLLDFVKGNLSDSDLELIGNHAQDCWRCQAELARLDAGSDTLLGRLRGIRSQPNIAHDDKLEGLLQRAKSISVQTKRSERTANAATVAPLSPQVLPQPASEQVGQYRLLEKIGEGGMGSVYKALHVSLDRLVALKMLNVRRLDDLTAVARFQREMKAVGRLNHPNIVRATDAGELAGVHYLVMDYVDGINLAELVRQHRPLSVANACELIRQASIGLEHAHEHGLIHRDIKPSNLMLDSEGQVRILDLGLARLHAGGIPADELTPSGMVMGTLDYMAPEQANDPKAVDIRADIYSLGCTLFHLLAGGPPFGSPARTFPAQKIAAHMHDPIPSIRELRHDVPVELAGIIERMLAKRPEDRFSAPAEVADVLHTFSAGSNLVRLLSSSERRDAHEADAFRCASTAVEAKLDTASVAKRDVDIRPSSAAVMQQRRLFIGGLIGATVLVASFAFIGLLLWQSFRHPPATEQGPRETKSKADLAAAPLPRQDNSKPPVSRVAQERKATATKTTAAAPVARPSDPKRQAPPAAAGAAELANGGFAFLKKYCYRCHGIDFKVPGYNVLDRTILIAKHEKDELPYITPGDPDHSLMWQRVGIEKDMPPSGTKPPDADRQLFKRWIEGGAPFPGRPSRPFKTERDILTAIRNHLRATDSADRKFQRYFTLTHLYNNNQSVTADELRLYRAALAKLANSLSWKPTIVVPRAIDREETIYNVDLRHLGWDEKGLWKEILKAYPYGLTHDHDVDVEMRTLASEVYDLAGNDQPYLRADWFIATASRPPVYHTVLQLPAHARILERQLQVDVQRDFRNNQLARAGLMTSGVSKQNRLLDRHDAVHGYYWKSYDFKSNEETANLVRFPLGPKFPGNQFARQAFEHAGGEIIFSLPNGLQGYLLVDNTDKRIDEGPIGIVRDAQETAGTPAIVNGLSCIGCHKHGMIRFEDKLRSVTAVGGEARFKVEELYRTTSDMNILLARDEKRFLQALESATASFTKVAEDERKDITQFPEPIGAIARLYVKDLDLQEAAFELGFSDAQKLKEQIQANPKLRELGLGPLLRDGAIKRELWSSRAFTISLLQNAARELGLGTPYVAF
jgi:serine/threonine-protein kinase